MRSAHFDTASNTLVIGPISPEMMALWDEATNQTFKINEGDTVTINSSTSVIMGSQYFVKVGLTDAGDIRGARQALQNADLIPFKVGNTLSIVNMNHFRSVTDNVDEMHVSQVALAIEAYLA